MKRRTIVLVTALLVVVAIGAGVWSNVRKDEPKPSIAPTSDPGGRKVSQATVKGTCSPSDGPAISLETAYEDKKLSVSIFEKGLELLEGGRRVVIINAHAAEKGTGQATLCSGKRNCVNFSDGRVEILNPSGVFNKDGAMELMVTVDGESLPVTTEWDKTPVQCD